MIKCPDNYSFVGADLSHYEMIITAMIGESSPDFSKKCFGTTKFTKSIYESDKDNNLSTKLEKEYFLTKDKAIVKIKFRIIFIID